MALSIASSVTALRDVTAVFDRTVRAARPFYPLVSTIVNSDGAEEKYAWLGDFPGMREWLGDRLFKELRAATYEIVNKHWESSLLVKKTDIADARMLKYGPLIEGLATEAAYHPDELLFSGATSLIVAGEATAGFDGQFFFDTDHSFGDSGSQSNDLTYAAATGTTPTTAEFRAAYNAAYAALVAFKGDNGKPLYRPTIDGNEFEAMVMVPPALHAIAADALSARNDADGNPITIHGRPQLVVMPYLTDATKFYVFDNSGPIKAFIFQQREPLSRQIKNMDDIEYKDAKFMTEARYNAGYGAWWKAVLTTFT